MNYRSALLVASLFVAGCATDGTQSVDARDHSNCMAYGYDAGTDRYLACRQFLAAQNAQRSAALMQLGSSLLQMSAPRPAFGYSGTTFYTINGRPLTCIQTGSVVNCN